MGTNYYLVEQTCPHCGRGNGRLHIGKSSAGWCFSLHVDLEQEITDLPDWEARWMRPGAEIADEYGKRISPLDMRAVILNRGGQPKWDKAPLGYPSWDVFHAQNDSEEGPGGLLRHRIGRSCVGHGSGTYDLIRGEFS